MESPPSKVFCSEEAKISGSKVFCSEEAKISGSKNSLQNVNNVEHVDNSSENLFQNFEDFEIVRVLNSSDEKCSLIVEGKLKGRPEKAVIILQKLPFSQDKFSDLFSNQTTLRTVFKNDVYYNKVASIPANLSEVKANIIFPAEDRHIKKYEKEECSFINETYDLYQNVTLPFIQSDSHCKQWIYNILEHKKEVDRIICEDLDPSNGFILVPDLKWTGEQMEDLYLQAIVMRRDLLSIRDLTGDHLPLLQNIYLKCTKAIKEKYGVPASKLRIYFHYQPSYYHLHLHFSALSFEAPGTWAGKARLLQDVMSNIKNDSDYYKKASLSFTLRDNHPMMPKFKEYESSK